MALGNCGGLQWERYWYMVLAALRSCRKCAYTYQVRTIFIWPHMVCLFVVLRHSNSISAISWQWYDVWDEDEKALLPTQGIFNLPHHIGMVCEELAFLWWRCKLYTAGKWIEAQINVTAMTRIHPFLQGHTPALYSTELTPPHMVLKHKTPIVHSTLVLVCNGSSGKGQSNKSEIDNLRLFCPRLFN